MDFQPNDASDVTPAEAGVQRKTRSWIPACAGMTILLTGLLAGCGPYQRVVKVAVALPLTGDIAALGQGLKRACTLALEDANSRGLFKGFQVKMVALDDRSDPREAVSIANRIVSDPSMVAVVGHFNSGCSIPASRVYARAHLPMISPAASNPKLTLQQLEPGWTYPRNIFRVNTTDDVQGPFAADYAFRKLKVRRASVIHDKTAYGQGVAEEFEKRFLALGGRVLSFDGVNVGDKDFNALLTRLQDLKPQMLYWGGDYAGGGLIVRQARGAGIQSPVILSEANLDPEYLRMAGSAAEGTYITFLGAPASVLPSSRAFVKAYHARFPDDELKSYDHWGYEAMSIILDLIAQAGPDKEKILAALPKIKHAGVLGVTQFDEKGDTLNKTITIFQVNNGKFEPIQ
jgi:branched-chain amino acid transport system substrate-binding protein